MALITFRNIHVSFGQPLLDGIGFSLEKGERVCLVGRNGAGKSTLLKLLTGDLIPDEGEIIDQEGLRIARLDQEVPLDATGSVFDVVAGGLGDTGELIRRFHDVSHRVASHSDSKSLAELEQCQHAIDAIGGWDLHRKVESLLSKLDLPVDTDVESLSGGLKRRVLLARALVSEPDVLLLDEPTNHLDLAAILWLEEFLLGWPGTLIFITHDRMFLQRLATRIIELDRGKLFDWPGDYATYLKRKEEQLNAEAKAQSEFDKRLAQEEAWIREGIKARRTRNMGRVRRLLDMRQERAERRGRTGQVSMLLQQAEKSGRLVVEAENVRFDYGGQPIVRDFSTTILRGDKVGIIGPNGCGKTTLLRLMLGELQPTSGRIRLGTNLQIAYFDQYRAQLEEEKSVIDNVAQGSDRVSVNGRNVHAIGYLKDFLFTPERARQPVKSLSGGERNRLLLARLFTQPANLLVLDEPTNDLDADTLELLEELLTDYDGTVLLVSHDRAFLNNLVTSVLAFEGDGIVNDYVGGYDDWVRQRPAPQPAPAKPAVEKPIPPKPVKEKLRKLSFKEQRELEALPQQIEALETEIASLNEAISRPEFYQQTKDTITGTQARLAELQQTVEAAYMRWEELEALREQLST
ncbi:MULTISPECIES: ATP-binding cassette domain-containing protein [Methylocaldum]|jgi:ATP-binding cassette subfamily F protein uup|uniref:ATP-binding cassette domain-containing protein n=1 Tax=Methylocaldum sp. RMAD-M TaxID=2806557 RepID=UPI000A31E6FF|nr:ATP-binding cassette domain-containing protein [Methylocaldum sp. RMAD-M]MBP1150492.1 ATP-binding cassette subfamily F protein uup [Methylocaldum sp. RMAD-M]MVF23605.1 ATP-binding cassette domain-containing protein [Methylocaldum sp. BRCS4]